MQYPGPALKSRHSNLPRGSRVDAEETLLKLIHTSASREKEHCFMTEERLLCKDIHCEWREQCCKLVATWRR
jgi:hypothetical protein